MMVAALLGLLSWLGLGPTVPPALHLQGYVEGDYVRVGSPIAGTLVKLDVARGQSVKSGQPLFALDRVAERAEAAEAKARLAQAQALLDDMRKGRRGDELKSIKAREAQARAALALSLVTQRREKALARRNFAARSALDRANEAVAGDRARVAELAAQYRFALLGARSDRIRAQAEAVAAARDAVAVATRHLADMSPTAPKAAFVQNVYDRPGDYVAPGQPVVSLLPPGDVKLVFFVPEPDLGAVRIGERIAYGCDSCRRGAAKVTYISSRAEYSPPVIYSLTSRAKLVYRAEARPLAHPLALHPGQPVDVTLDLAGRG